MRHDFGKYYISPPPMNPLSRLLVALASILAFAGAFFFGLIAIIVIVGLMVIAGVVFWLYARISNWRRGGAQVQQTRPSEQGSVIDAEYEVVSRRRD